MQPNISVCLASFNGEKYIREQITSILPQLSESDQLVICDDDSSDSTCEVVLSFNDPRILLLKNERNIGHVKNFEKALSLAKGRYIFLADQDNIWAPEKVAKTLFAFKKNQAIKLVTHSMETIDKSGVSIKGNERLLNSRGVQSSLLFLLRQMIKPNVFGCTCCIDSQLLKPLLKFPAAVYAHDHWIAVVAAVYGKVYNLDEALIKYRLHDANLTPKKKLSSLRSIVFRFKLIFLMVISICRRVFLHL